MACGWKLLETSDGSSSITEDYVTNFYNVLQLLQGQGMEAKSLQQSVFAAFATLAGSLVLAIVFGNVAILVSNFNANSTNYQRKMESVFAIMSKLQLPAPLRERIHQYYEHLWREYESLDGEIVAFSKGLSHTLELEVVLFKYMDLIMHVPFWRDGSPDFQKQLMLSLHVRVYLPDDFIIRRGEIGDEFFMINRGICELVLDQDSVETTTADALEGDGDGSNSGGSHFRSGGVTGRREGSSTARKEYFDRVRAPLTSRKGGTSEDNTRLSAVRILRRGQTFGELALLINYERTASARCDHQHANSRDEVQRASQCALPLKDMVQNALPDREQTRLSTMHAALLLVKAIDEERDDDSIKFGISPSLQRKLKSIIGGHHARNDQHTLFGSHAANLHSPKRDTPPDIDSGCVARSHRDMNLDEALCRIDRLEATQAQLLQLIRDMHEEVRGMRCSYVDTTHAVTPTNEQSRLEPDQRCDSKRSVDRDFSANDRPLKLDGKLQESDGEGSEGTSKRRLDAVPNIVQAVDERPQQLVNDGFCILSHLTLLM